MTDDQLVQAVRALQAAIDRVKACRHNVTEEEHRRLYWSAAEAESALLWLKSVRPNAVE